MKESAAVKVRSPTVAEAHKSSSTNSTGGLKVACGQTVSVHAANAKKYTWNCKRTRSNEISFTRKTQLQCKQVKWKLREDELCNEVIELEGRYVALEKELALEQMQNEYLKATCQQYRKQGKEIRAISFASFKRETALFRKCNGNIEYGVLVEDR